MFIFILSQCFFFVLTLVCELFCWGVFEVPDFFSQAFLNVLIIFHFWFLLILILIVVSLWQVFFPFCYWFPVSSIFYKLISSFSVPHHCMLLVLCLSLKIHMVFSSFYSHIYFLVVSSFVVVTCMLSFLLFASGYPLSLIT